jgi:hypothetical protein
MLEFFKKKSLAVLAREAIRLVVQALFHRSLWCGLLVRPLKRVCQKKTPTNGKKKSSPSTSLSKDIYHPQPDERQESGRY